MNALLSQLKTLKEEVEIIEDQLLPLIRSFLDNKRGSIKIVYIDKESVMVERKYYLDGQDEVYFHSIPVEYFDDPVLYKKNEESKKLKEKELENYLLQKQQESLRELHKAQYNALFGK